MLLSFPINDRSTSFNRSCLSAFADYTAKISVIAIIPVVSCLIKPPQTLTLVSAGYPIFRTLLPHVKERKHSSIKTKKTVKP
jgi:hypothetical protein